MRSLTNRFFVSSFSFTAVALLAATASMSNACTVTSATDDGGASDSATGDAATSDGAVIATLPFQPSNVDLSGIDVSKATEDQDLTGTCTIVSDGPDACFDNNVGTAQLVQSDNTKIVVIIVKSLRIEAAAHVTISGGLPLAIISLGDMTILGSIDSHAQGQVAGAGGFTQEASNMLGSGPGGGTAGSGSHDVAGVAGGGASFCGLGGLAGQENGGPAPASPTASYGAADLRPLVAGSSGGSSFGSGGGGGGGLQLVAAGTLSIAQGSYINVGGGGGGSGGATGASGGGGGSGGAILLEGTTVTISGILTANGGGGGGAGVGGGGGGDATANSTAAPGGVGSSPGGVGSTTQNGGAGLDQSGEGAGGGGGGAGRIRINSQSGTVDLSTATISPPAGASDDGGTDAGATSCVTVGTVRATGSGS